MWDLPGPGLEPVSPALAGGFLTTAPPGKSPDYYFKGSLEKSAGTIHCPMQMQKETRTGAGVRKGTEAEQKSKESKDSKNGFKGKPTRSHLKESWSNNSKIKQLQQS